MKQILALAAMLFCGLLVVPQADAAAQFGRGDDRVCLYQDIHFEGQTLIAIQRVGENGADRIAIEFDQNFATCAPRGVLRGTDNGRPVRIIGWDGRVLRRISGQSTSRPSCVVRDGNTFGQ